MYYRCRLLLLRLFIPHTGRTFYMPHPEVIKFALPRQSLATKRQHKTATNAIYSTLLNGDELSRADFKFQTSFTFHISNYKVSRKLLLPTPAYVYVKQKNATYSRS